MMDTNDPTNIQNIYIYIHSPSLTLIHTLLALKYYFASISHHCQQLKSMSKRQSYSSYELSQHSIQGIDHAYKNKGKTQKSDLSLKVEENLKKSHDHQGEQYVPPEYRSKAQSAVPSYDEFKQRIKELYEMLNKQTIDEQFLKMCYDIFAKVCDKNGIVEVSSINEFPKIVYECAKKWPEIKFSMTEIEDLRQVLFSYEFIKQNPDSEVKMYNLGIVNFVDKFQLKKNKFDLKEGIQYFLHDTTLFQQGADGLQIDKFVFNLDYMSMHYANQTIDIRIQNPLDFGFCPNKLKNKPYKMSLSDYRFYQENYLDTHKMQGFKHSHMLNKGQIFFGVNFEPADNMLEEKIKKHVQDTFLDFHNQFDLLSYLDTDVPGCSSPQMYFKVPGCWTGGHQENISMSALNINNGPEYSQWYTLQLKYVQALRAELNQKFGTDLYLAEGLWYEKLDWFIKRGYPVKRFLQRRDDIVITGPGTLHWVRSFGSALQTSWNIMFKSYQQLQASFMRHQFNKQVNFPHSAVIPLKSIIVKYLNHQRQTMSKEIRELCVNKVKEWLEFEQQILNQYKETIYQRDQFYLKDLESFCILCNQQILLYYLPAPKEKLKGISCLQCFKKSEGYHRPVEILYTKNSPYFLWKLVEICFSPEKNAQFKFQLQQLCKGEFVGKIGVPCRVKEKKENEEIFMTFKDNRQIKKMEREILYGNNFLYELYEMIENFKNFEPKVQRLMLQSSRRNEQFDFLENEHKKQPLKSEIQKVDCECQTNKVIIFEQGEQQERKRSRSRQKHKKKHKKHKSNNRQSSPIFASSNSKSRSRSRSRSKQRQRQKRNKYKIKKQDFDEYEENKQRKYPSTSNYSQKNQYDADGWNNKKRKGYHNSSGNRDSYTTNRHDNKYDRQSDRGRGDYNNYKYKDNYRQNNSSRRDNSDRKSNDNRQKYDRNQNWGRQSQKMEKQRERNNSYKNDNYFRNENPDPKQKAEEYQPDEY